MLTSSQLKSIKKSCQISAKTFVDIKKLIKPGLTEKEVAYKIRKIMKSLGAEGLAFRPIVATGSGSSQPHHKNTTQKIKLNDIVLLDFGAKVDGWCSDLSRTIFIGQPRPEWLKVYHIVKTAQQKVFDFLERALPRDDPQGTIQDRNRYDPGSEKLWIGGIGKASELDKVARDYIAKKGYGKYFIHGLGHGIGKRVHQYFKINPKSKSILRPGMIFTIEPGIYLKGRFGVRFEDTIHLTSGGLKILTAL